MRVACVARDADTGIPLLESLSCTIEKNGGFNVCVSLASLVTHISGYPCRRPSGEHPANAKCRRGDYSPSLGS